MPRPVRRTVVKLALRLVLTTLIVATVGVATVSESAAACSCVGPALAIESAVGIGVDGAFVGVVRGPVDGPRPQHGRRWYSFDVEAVYVGELGPTVSVEFPDGGAACGYDDEPLPDRVGVLLRREGDEWSSNICSVVPPDALAALGTPTTPTSSTVPPATTAPVDRPPPVERADARPVAATNDTGSRAPVASIGIGAVIGAALIAAVWRTARRRPHA